MPRCYLYRPSWKKKEIGRMILPKKYKLTEVGIKRLNPPSDKSQIDVWDGGLPGFGIRVTKTGTKTFQVITYVAVRGQAKPKQVRMKIGRFPQLSLKEARLKAVEIQRLAEQGHDPRDHRRDRNNVFTSDTETFGSVKEKFLKHRCEPILKPKTFKQYSSLLAAPGLKKLNDIPLDQIDSKTLRKVLNQIKGTGRNTTANRLLEILKVMFKWAVSEEIIEHSPAERITTPSREVVRDRVLSLDEIKVLWWALTDVAGPMEKVHKLLLLTGQRRGEISNMKWSELESLKKGEGMLFLPKERVKNGYAHKVPLSDPAIKLIKSMPVVSDEYVFSTDGINPSSVFSKEKKKVEKRCEEICDEKGFKGLFNEPWRVHDLRRTAATHMAEMGVSIDVVELILNHRSGVRSGIVAVYNRSELMADRRRALAMWADKVMSIVSE
jgi:integrase